MNHGLYSCASRLPSEKMTEGMRGVKTPRWKAPRAGRPMKWQTKPSASYSLASRRLRLPARGFNPSLLPLLLFALCLLALPAAQADTPDALFAAGKFEPARAGYTTAVLAAPRDPALRIGLVRTLLRLDQWADAVTEARAAAVQFPQNADLHGLFALALIRAGWQPPCVDEAKQSLTLDATDYWGLVASGRLADWDGKEAEARTDFRKAASAQPALPDAWLGLIETLDDEQDAKEKEAATAAYLKLGTQGYPHDRERDALLDFQTNAAAYEKAFGGKSTFSRVGAQTPEAAKSATVTVEFVRDYAVFPVILNGKKFRLLFDTGGGEGVTLAKNPARRLGLTPVAHSYLRGVGGKDPSDVLRAETLTLGGLTLQNIVINTMRDTPAGTDGLLSGEVLDDSVVTLDYVQAAAMLSHGPAAAAPPPLPGDAVVAVPFRVYRGHLFCLLALNTVPLWTMLDTGDEQTFLSLRLAKTQLSTVSKDDSRQGTFKGRSGIGSDARTDYIYSDDESDIALSQSPLAMISTKTIGVSSLDRYISPDFGFEIGMLLGASTFTSARRVTFDYPRRLMTFEYVIPPPEPAPAEKPGKKTKK